MNRRGRPKPEQKDNLFPSTLNEGTIVVEKPIEKKVEYPKVTVRELEQEATDEDINITPPLPEIKIIDEKQKRDFIEKATPKKYVAKEYRLTDDRSGEAFLLKTGKSGNLLKFDFELGFNRAIRHCPNEKSIYIDEQSDFALVEPIIFERGRLKVDHRNQLTQKFLESHPDNVKNGGNWFEEINDRKEARQEIQTEELILDIKQKVRDKSKESGGIYQLEMLVSVLLNSVVRASEMSKEELKRTIYQQADTNPDFFTDDFGNINIFDDHYLQRKYMVLRGLNDGVIKKSFNGKSIVWGDNGNVIINAPQGKDLIEHFTEHLATDEGSLILAEFKKKF